MAKENKKVLSLVVYMFCITLYSLLAAFLYGTFLNFHFYYLFVTIPLFFLLVTLIIVNIIKMIIILIAMIFGRNDNDEVNVKMQDGMGYVNRLCKYVLIAIFVALLTSIMILDIVLCVKNNLYLLLSLSIVIWLLLYYVLFRIIIKVIKREIRL